MTWRDTASDAARIQLIVDPPWLMPPVLAREAIPPDWLPDWSRWWQAALAFRPGGPAPRQLDLVAFSPVLTRFWQTVLAGSPADSFDPEHWLAQRSPGPVPPVEQDALFRFSGDTGREPAPRTLTVLAVPFGDELFERPESDRLVVDAQLRLTGERYLALLRPVLADYY